MIEATRFHMPPDDYRMMWQYKRLPEHVREAIFEFIKSNDEGEREAAE